jgi:hypothetical protein
MMVAQINCGNLVLKLYEIVVNLQSSDEDNTRSVTDQLLLYLPKL